MRKYEHILDVGDFNIDISVQKIEYDNYLFDLCDTLSQSDSALGVAYTKSLEGSTVDIMCKNSPTRFYYTCLIEAGTNDFRKVLVSLFRPSLRWLPVTTIECWNCNNFHIKKVLHDLDQEIIKDAI